LEQWKIEQESPHTTVSTTTKIYFDRKIGGAEEGAPRRTTHLAEEKTDLQNAQKLSRSGAGERTNAGGRW